MILFDEWFSGMWPCTPVSWLSKGTRESICWTNQMQVHAWTGPEHGLNSAFPSSLGSLQRRSCRWWCLLSSSPQWWSREPEPVSPAPPPPQLPNKSWYGIIHVPTLKSSIRTETTPEAKSSQEPQAATGRHRQPQASPSHLHANLSQSAARALFCCCRLRGNTFQILQSRKNMKSYLQIRRGTVWLAPQSLQLGYLQTLLHWEW